MRRPQLWLLLGGLALLAAAAGYRLGVLGNSAETATAAAPQLPIFETVLTDLKGQTQSLGQWRGKVLVVNYWATWCHPCREEMPGFSRLQDKYRDKGVQFVGISIDTIDKIIEFQKTTPVNYPLLIGDIGVMENSAKLGNVRQALPFTAVFDRQGRLAATKLGRLAEPELERQLKELISP
ncbi:MAG: TlpA disulfide reductase family protein [Betaproteobacteria bacterium]|nr:TlpA disulfide reductase family protein [Betaproteobacteria bacterium]